MRILLIRSARIKQSITVGEIMFCEPIGLEAVYAVLKDRHTIRILDMMVEPVDVAAECAAWKPDVVGLTSLCIDVFSVLDIARKVRAFNPAIVTVVGGTQAYLNPGAFHDASVDHIMVYTTRANLGALFGYLERREPVPALDGVQSREHAYKAGGVAGRNEYIVPDRESTRRYRSHYSYFGYKPCAIMQTSQGCGKHCHFCLRWRIEGGEELSQEMPVVLDQIRSIEEPSIMIVDNDFLHDAGRLNALCDGLEKHGVQKNFICYGSVFSILHNREAITRFAGNGLRAVLVGYESFREEELRTYRKKSSVDDNLAASRVLKELGVDAWASIIMHPDWTHDDFRQLRRHIRILRPEVTSPTALTPFPNLPLYEEYRGRILFQKEDYEKWTFSMVSIMPSRMSLRAYYYEVLKTLLYINLVQNNTGFLIRKFGFSTVFRIGAGSIRLMRRYIKLMFQAPGARPV